VQVEPHSVDLDASQIVVARATQLLNELSRKSVGAAVDQIDDDPAGGPVEMRGDRPRLSLKQFAAQRLGLC